MKDLVALIIRALFEYMASMMYINRSDEWMKAYRLCEVLRKLQGLKPMSEVDALLHCHHLLMGRFNDSTH